MATLVPKYDRLLGALREDDTSGEVPATRTLTLTGTTNQVNVSGGTQDLSADRTWTFSTPQNIHTGATPTFAGLTINGTEQVFGTTGIGITNSQTPPNTQGNGGLGVLWNYSGGSAELALFNQFNTGGGFTGGFRFFQGSGSNTYTEMAWLKWSAGNTSLVLNGTSNPSIFFGTDTQLSRDGATSLNLGGRLTTNYATTVDASIACFNNGITATLSGTSASRFWGSLGGASTFGSANYTDGWCVNGFEGNCGHQGTGTNAGGNGLLFYMFNSNTGTLTTARAIHLITGVNSGGGHITDYYHIQTEGFPAYSANGQTRAHIQLDASMPSVGGFTGTKTAAIWHNYDTTDVTNGIAWGTALDTVIYRGASAQLNLTGSYVISANLTVSTLTSGSVPFIGASGLVSQNNNQLFWNNSSVFLGINTAATPSAHLHVLGVTPAVSLGAGINASFGAKILGGVGGATISKTNNGGNGGAILIQGGGGGANTNGSASGVGGNGADVSLNAGPAGTSVGGNGTIGSVYIYKSNGSTKLLQGNDTGLGFFAATPVAQQTGDIGAGLVSLGLFSSTTSTTNVVASGRQTAQTAADTNVVTYATPAADHSYLISTNVLVTASTLHSFTTTCSYTDESNTARVLTLNYSQLTGAFVTAITNGTGASSYEGVPVQIRVKASTSIVIATTGTFTSVTYNVEAAITQVT